MALRNILCGLFAVNLLFLTACQTTKPKRAGIPKRPQPAKPVLTDQKEDDFSGPEVLADDEPRKVALILGPGGAKAFAHVGVLKALQQRRVPIHKVVGLEWGALVGGLYALNGQVHDVEWKLYKMEQRNLPHPKGFFGSKGVGEESVNVMNAFLKESFGNGDISQSKVKFECPTRSIWTGVVTWQFKGAFNDAIKRCLVYPPVFKAQGTFLAGASQATEAIERLVKEGYNVIIFVNVLGSAMPVAQDSLSDHLNHVVLWQEVKRSLADAAKYNIDLINIDTSAHPIVKFNSKKDLIAMGERAGGEAAAQLIVKYRF